MTILGLDTWCLAYCSAGCIGVMNRSSLSITLPSLVSKHVCLSTFIANTLTLLSSLIVPSCQQEMVYSTRSTKKSDLLNVFSFLGSLCLQSDFVLSYLSAFQNNTSKIIGWTNMEMQTDRQFCKTSKEASEGWKKGLNLYTLSRYEIQCHWFEISCQTNSYWRKVVLQILWFCGYYLTAFGKSRWKDS